MDNAKPNERSLPAEGFLPAGRTGWSRRLEEPGALPGVGLADKEAAWDKLYERLRETPRRRTLPWLWTAAACLLLALVPAALLLKEKRTIPHSGGPKVVIQPKTTQPRTLLKPGQARTYPATGAKPFALAPGAPIRNTLPRSTPPGTPAHSLQLAARRLPLAACRSPHPAPRTPHPAPRYFPDTLAHSSQLIAHSLQLPPPDLPQSLTAAIPPATPKKQPRVIHINELEPAQPTPSMAGERLRPGRLQVRFTQPETFRPTTSYNNNPIDYPVIPLKHSQNP
jgi:hypothetical protein